MLNKYYFILLLTTSAFSQSGMVVLYENIQNIDYTTKSIDTLFIAEEKTIYKQGFAKEINFSNAVEDYESTNVIEEIKHLSTDTFWFDLKQNSLLSRVNVFSNTLSIIEKTPKINWNLTKETFIKNNIVLHKATTSFRGRNYIALYDPATAIPYGPWKLNGLPGLIYEVYDTDKMFHWYIKAILHKDSNLSIPKFEKNISMQEFNSFVKDYEENLLLQLKNNYGRDAKVELAPLNLLQKIKEKEFE